MSNDWQSATGISPKQNSETESLAPLSIDNVVVVSNRQPYRHRYEQNGDGDGSRAERSIAVDRPTGGLTAGLDPVMQKLNGTWIAWGDGEADRDATSEDGQVSVPPEEPEYTLQRLWLTDKEIDGYYYGYSNRALWPLCHLAMGRTVFDGEQWRTYRRVNQKFAEKVVDNVDDDTVVWFQDYHLACAPRTVRLQSSSSPFLLHFWHIPWPSIDAFRACPQHQEILKGLLGNDLIGFHVTQYCRNFLECAARLVEETEVDYDRGLIRHDGHETAVSAFPMGVEADSIEQLSEAADESAWQSFKHRHAIGPNTRVVLGVDRLDYTKGIPERLEALEHLWNTQPEWQGQFTYVQKGTESRSEIPAYQRLQNRVDEIIDRVNSRFGTDEWQPIVLVDENLPRKTLCGLYRYSDAAIVSPLRDGMNLVAQEYIASQVDDDGVLILSELAGSHEALGDAVLSVNPYDTEAHAKAIDQALTMPAAERRNRTRRLRRRVHNNDLSSWLNDVFEGAQQLREEQEAKS
ncbi:alpha,alpha-trehalose-phosphate synthase (UDP-forming) [Halocatena marina]|uniref:Trehalose-6-phosphate synthase n=1 Tax=Halocatena marina TaxID=2934937 RepID=A0ABD5YSP5_9EURY|nr:trehalose-6-phosphate synthase [Halocatena marina]